MNYYDPKIATFTKHDHYQLNKQKPSNDERYTTPTMFVKACVIVNMSVILTLKQKDNTNQLVLTITD